MFFRQTVKLWSDIIWQLLSLLHAVWYFFSWYVILFLMIPVSLCFSLCGSICLSWLILILMMVILMMITIIIIILIVILILIIIFMEDLTKFMLHLSLFPEAKSWHDKCPLIRAMLSIFGHMLLTYILITGGFRSLCLFWGSF